jgi:hypothetical protein
MRRVLAYCTWRASWWEMRNNMRTNLMLDLQEGLRAYAVRQSLIHKGRALHFQMLWSVTEEQVLNPGLHSPDLDAIDSDNANEDEDSEDNFV